MRQIQPYSFDTAKVEWSRPPVDNIGYLSSRDLLTKTDTELSALLAKFTENRYSLDGWRNYKNRWRDLLGLDTIKGKTIMDFGCGVGLESVVFAENGNRVILADISDTNLDLSRRVMHLCGQTPQDAVLVTQNYPFFAAGKFDVFHANGVLHHTPLFREILQRAVECLNPDGWIQLMLYSDKGWEKATGSPPPPLTKAMDHPQFHRFVAFFDGVGFYADWFNEDKINNMVGDFLMVEYFEYITVDDRYLITILRPR